MRIRNILARTPGVGFVAGVVLLACAVLLAACGGGDDTASAGGNTPSGGASGKGKIIALASGGSFGRALNADYFIPYEKETGVKVELVEGPEDPIPQVKAQVQAGKAQWDVVACTVKQALQEPIWEPIDYGIVKHTAGLLDKESKGEVYIAQILTAYPVLAYNTKSMKQKPTGWTDYFDTKRFPGVRGAPNLGLDSAWAMPAIALLADGVAPEDLVPFDLDRAYRKLDALRDDIKVFWSSFSQAQDLIRSGEMAISPLIDGRTLQLIDQGQPVGIVWNQAFVSHGAFCTPKGAPNAENAMKFYDWVLANGEAQGQFTSTTFYGPVTEAGSRAAKKIGVTDHTGLHLDELVPESPELLKYVSDNDDKLLDRWNRYVEGQ